MYIIIIENRKHETERLFKFCVEYYLKPISLFILHSLHRQETDLILFIKARLEYVGGLM